MSEYTTLVEDSRAYDRIVKCLDQLNQRGSCRFTVGDVAHEVRAYMLDDDRPGVLLSDLRLIVQANSVTLLGEPGVGTS